MPRNSSGPRKQCTACSLGNPKPDIWVPVDPLDEEEIYPLGNPDADDGSVLRTALRVGVGHCAFEYCTLLLQAGADPNLDGSLHKLLGHQSSCLMIDTQKTVGLCALLLECRAQVDICSIEQASKLIEMHWGTLDGKGETAPDASVLQEAQLSICEMLLHVHPAHPQTLNQAFALRSDQKAMIKRSKASKRSGGGFKMLPLSSQLAQLLVTHGAVVDEATMGLIRETGHCHLERMCTGSVVQAGWDSGARSEAEADLLALVDNEEDKSKSKKKKKKRNKPKTTKGSHEVDPPAPAQPEALLVEVRAPNSAKTDAANVVVLHAIQGALKAQAQAIHVESCLSQIAMLDAALSNTLSNDSPPKAEAEDLCQWFQAVHQDLTKAIAALHTALSAGTCVEGLEIAISQAGELVLRFGCTELISLVGDAKHRLRQARVEQRAAQKVASLETAEAEFVALALSQGSVVPASNCTAALAPAADADATLCVVCICERKEMLLLPCKHVCLCEDCVGSIMQQQKPLQLCPLCRTPIESNIKVFVCC